MITLRPATMDDRDILRQWRNDLNAERLTSIVPPPSEVTWQEHETWLALWIYKMWRRESPNDRMREGLFMAIDSERGLIGTGRITTPFLHGPIVSGCLIHYTVAPEHRKKGLGTQLVRALVDEARVKMGYGTVGAQIHRANIASLKCALMGGVTAVEFL